MVEEAAPLPPMPAETYKMSGSKGAGISTVVMPPLPPPPPPPRAVAVALGKPLPPPAPPPMQTMRTMAIPAGFSQGTHCVLAFAKPGNTSTKPFCGFGTLNTLIISSHLQSPIPASWRWCFEQRIAPRVGIC